MNVTKTVATVLMMTPLMMTALGCESEPLQQLCKTDPRCAKVFVDITEARGGRGGTLHFANPRVTPRGVFWQHTIADRSFGNVMFPLKPPNGAVIAALHVVYGGQTEDGASNVSVWRRPIAAPQPCTEWERLQSAGPTPLPATGNGTMREPAQGLDTGLAVTTDYEYAAWVEVKPNQSATIFGVVLTYFKSE